MCPRSQNWYWLLPAQLLEMHSMLWMLLRKCRCQCDNNKTLQESPS
jgi:hypothetical protein